MTYENPQMVDPAVLDEAEETPEIRLARDLAAGQEASPSIKQVGQQAADSVAPDEDKLDEGDLADYDQEQLAVEREKE